MTALEQPIIQYPGAKSVPAPHLEPSREPAGKISFEIEIGENDVRARQFACRLVLRNKTPNSIDVLAVNHRLGSGVTMERSDNTSFDDLKKEFDQLRNEIRALYRSLYIIHVDGFSKKFAQSYLDGLRSQFRFKNIFMVYLYMITGRLKLIVKQMAQALQRMDFPITSSGDARKILKRVAKVEPSVVILLKAKIDRMEAIEKIDQNFLRPEFVTQVQPGEDFERVYILKAKRKLSSIASYTAAFDVKLAWEESSTNGSTGRHVERIVSRSASFNVTPSPITLSIFAVIFSVLGAVVNSISSPKMANVRDLSWLLNQSFLEKSFVAAVLAVVLYNSIEMTELKDRVRSISWRSAMFIGIICGLLSDKMLKAITSFVGN